MTDKPLSETHPTLWVHPERVYQRHKHEDVLQFTAEVVQSTTVDIAEYERLKKELEEMKSAALIVGDIVIPRDEEIDRLVKELEESRKLTQEWRIQCNKSMAEGERRAMERVKAAIDNQSTFGTIDTSLLKRELGLGEEIKEIVSPNCERPYGDNCGYCTECKRYARERDRCNCGEGTTSDNHYGFCNVNKEEKR